MGSMSNLLFSYGTLNLEEVQRYLWGEAKRGRVKQLNDYRLNSYNNNIMFITKEFGETVAGKVYQLTPEQMERTDRYEGDAYERKLVRIDDESVYIYVQTKESK